MLLQASSWPTPVLGHIEAEAAAEVDSARTVLSDIFARVGGPDGGPATPVGPVGAMLLIERARAVLDHVWLWRADHTAEGGPVRHGANPVAHGLVVGPHAAGVVALGVFSEHTLADNTLWQGEGGVSVFHQAEIAYDAGLGDIADAAVATDDGDGDSRWPFACYTVGAAVLNHTVLGAGCYSNFRGTAALARSGLSAPAAASVVQPFAVFLDGYGAIEHPVNGAGAEANSSHRVSFVC